MNHSRSLEFVVHRNPMRVIDGIELYLIAHRTSDKSGRPEIAKPLEFEAPVHEFEAAAPTAVLSKADAQALYDELHRAGFRPTDEASAKGELSATKRHLEDVRAIAFAKLEIPIPASR